MASQPSLLLLFRVFVLSLLGPVLQATVFVNQAEVANCRGAVTELICTTTTGTGFLLWRNSSGKSIGFDDAATVDATGTLGSTTMTLDSIEAVSNAVVYTSTATENNMMENTTIQCSDGDVPQNINLFVKSPSSPLWALSACRFSHNKVQLSWNAPSVAPECCAQYIVQLSTGSVNTTETFVAVPISNETITATVYCVDDGKKMVAKTEDMIINTNTAIERITIEPVNSSCDANTTYQISWTTNTFAQNVCIPPITNSTITCTTSSTHQSSSNNSRSMNCSVPANEPITATVAITNAAGLTASKSAHADVLAQACSQKSSSVLVSCTPSGGPGADQLQPAGIAAVFMGLGLFFVILILAVACTTFFLVKKQIIIIKLPLWKEESAELKNGKITKEREHTYSN